MRDIKLSIIICTFKREQYVLKNIELLNSKCRDYIYKVFVIDNGKTLDTKLNNGFINIIPNNNLGGSGGYARGMYEANKEGKSTHIMLMDDDIEFEPIVLEKAVNRLANFTDEESKDWIGFGMVSFDKPNEIYECGAFWNGIRAVSNNNGLEISSNKDIDSSLKYNYSGWWSLIMPITVIKDYGYPLPFFLKHDDAEYGMRRRTEKIHFYKDLYIKHESFESKYNPKISFFNERNSLIMNIFHVKHDYRIALLKYILLTSHLYFRKRFSGIKMATLGLNCFLNKTDIMNDNLMANTINVKKINSLFGFLVMPFIVIGNLFKLIFKYKKAKKYYIKLYPILISNQYWQKYFA